MRKLKEELLDKASVKGSRILERGIADGVLHIILRLKKVGSFKRGSGKISNIFGEVCMDIKRDLVDLSRCFLEDVKVESILVILSHY